VSVETPWSAVVAHLVNERIGALPVVDGAGKLVGIVSYRDVLQALR
jgi:CBS-domain-containing membrane protein